MNKKPIGELLKEKGLVTDSHIRFALQEQQATGERLGEVLTRLGIVTDFEIAQALSEQSGYPYLDPRGLAPEKKALMRIPGNFARENEVLPFKLEGQKLHVAIADPFDRKILGFLEKIARLQIEPYVAPSSEIKHIIEWYYYLLQYPPEKEISQLVERLRKNPQADFNAEQLWHNLMVHAISQRAADLHLVPSEKSCRVYYRLDGILELTFVLPQAVHTRLVGAIKVRAGMDIAEQRLPQDGRLRFEFLGEEYDLRISTVRGVFGENLVARILPVKATVLHLESLGFTKEEVKTLRNLFNQPQGMILVTGPTGSGKTTTLYSALRLLDTITKNVMTAEDPVEYSFPLIRQTQINEEISYTFAAAIKHFLRQDPDVILVGEIRDEETASMAVRAALTGHLFLSTLHTNDAISSIDRLRDLGVNNSLLASALKGVTAQRLLRHICPHCREEYQPPKELLDKYQLPPERTYYRGRGCENCRDTGYLGRFAIMEVFVISPAIQDLIAEGAPSPILFKKAQKEGFKTLREAGTEKVLQGETTVEELARVLG